MASKVVYHWKANNFKGSKIVDLYTLQKELPQLFSGAAAKYETSSARKRMLKNTPVPNLGCIWNAAIHTSTIHPQLIVDAKRKFGLPTGLEPTEEGGAAMTGEYFKIPVQQLLDSPKVSKMVHWNFPPMTGKTKLGMAANCLLKWFDGCFSGVNTLLFNRRDYPVLDHAYLDKEFKNLDALPAWTAEMYKQWGEELKQGKEPQILTYIGCPHVLVKGEIDVTNLEVIKVQ